MEPFSNQEGLRCVLSVLLATQALALRYHVLYNHLALRQALGHVQDVPLPSPAEVAELIASWKVKLGQRARYVENDVVEEASKPSHVANVRDDAMDDGRRAAKSCCHGSAISHEDKVASMLHPVVTFDSRGDSSLALQTPFPSPAPAQKGRPR